MKEDFESEQDSTTSCENAHRDQNKSHNYIPSSGTLSIDNNLQKKRGTTDRSVLLAMETTNNDRTQENGRSHRNGNKRKRASQMQRERKVRRTSKHKANNQSDEYGGSA